MATKWKNIIETGKRLLKQQWQVLVSVMLAGCGIFVFYILIAYRTYYPTEKILYFGILGNILLGSGTAYLLEKGPVSYTHLEVRLSSMTTLQLE